MKIKLIVEGLLIPIEKDSQEEYLRAAAAKLKVQVADIEIEKILFKSLNIKDLEQFYYELSLAVTVPASYVNNDNFALFTESPLVLSKREPITPRPIVIGFGPAGMFAALALIERGQSPLIFERGKSIEERHVDILRFLKDRVLTKESNIQYGDGGAGLYSDGKIFSRPNNSVYATKVIDTFIKFGAPPAIRYTNKPHIGTDVLCTIVANIKKHILAHGGEIRYQSKLTDVIINKSKCTSIIINDTEEYQTSGVYLAVGNSARDTFRMLDKRRVLLEPKPVSIGVRIEHPTEVINQIRYGKKYKDYAGLGAANYSFTYTNRVAHRNAYTFCMCPGGEIVNASSEDGMLAINGMSYSARNSPYSNSAIVVTGSADDLKPNYPLSVISLQRDIERNAFVAGGSDWMAPAQNLVDFMRKKQSGMLNENSFKMGTQSADLDTVFPPFMCETLREAFTAWKAECPLFVSEEAILLGAETRTSSPVRMMRRKNFQSVSVNNIYPIGEGSGYSGGINSAAIDAIRAVEAVLWKE